MKIHNMQKVAVSYKDLPNNVDYPFLEDDLNELARELLEKSFGVEPDTLKLAYSLGYSQGDGVCFMKLRFNEEDSEKLWNKYAPRFDFPTGCFYAEHAGGHYYHENSMNIGFETMDLIENEEIGAECNRIEELFAGDIKRICREIERAGYAYIEEENKRELGRFAVEKFFEVNNIEEEPYEQDVFFEGEQGDDYVLVGTVDGTNVYIQNAELKEHTRTTLVDGKETTAETFYTFN